MPTLIGAIGYRNLRDHSAAFHVLERLSHQGAGAGVFLEDMSYNPIAIVQWLQGEPQDRRFDHVILVSAVERGRAAGAVHAYRWDGVLPPDAAVQQAVTEAVTGIIALENTVVIGGYFRVFPDVLTIIEIEPVDHAFGPELSENVAAAIDPACLLVQALARDGSGGLPVSPLPQRHALRAGGL